MKKYPILLALLMPLFALAQSEVEVKSTIEDVTVFTSGAQVSRSAKMNLTAGTNILAFEDLSAVLDEKSLQFKAGGDFSILSIKYEVRFNESDQARKADAARLNARLKQLGEEVKSKRDLLAVSVNEEQVLLANTDFDMWEGMNITQLQQGVDLVRSRLTEIKQRKQRLNNEIDDLNQERQKVVNQLQEMRIEDALPNGVAIVKLKSETARTVDATISYVVADAGWEPYYDLRVENVAAPLQIEYKAKVHQNTGEEWKNVNLTLSTGNPYEEGRLPQLDPWFLNFVGPGYRVPVPLKPAFQKPGITGVIRGVIVDASTEESIPFANIVAFDNGRNIVAGATSDLDGKFRLEISSPVSYLEISFTGYATTTLQLQETSSYQVIRLKESTEQLQEVEITYSKPMIDPMKSSSTFSRDDMDYSSGGGINVRGARDAGTTYYIQGQKIDEFKISQNQVNLKFEVDIPYDIPSDGEEYKVNIKDFEKEVNYLYRAVPKLNEHAFLTASLTDWEELNLMNGSAGIYYEGTYLGETYLNVEEAGDTLQVSLGKDENIVVLRNTVKQKEGTRFFSNKKEERFHYEIKVRNNKSAPLQLEITDQFPLSGNDEITVERVESTGGEVEDKTGIITWKFTLEPKEEKKLDLIYNVRYPQGRSVNLR